MELTFLGTGSAYPTPTRAASGTVFRLGGSYWLFDCGEGTQIQLMKSKVRLGKLSKIFITHLHGDHLFGLPGLLCTLSQHFTPETKDTIDIYGPQGLRHYLRTALQLSVSELGIQFSVSELMPQSELLPANYDKFYPSKFCDEVLHPNEVLGRQIFCTDGYYELFKDDAVTVRAGPLIHRVPCYGFVIEETPRLGKLNVELLKTLGVTPGPLYAQLKKGQSITSPSGQLINPSDVTEAARAGRKVVILGDTADSTGIKNIAMNATVLVHEATLENAMLEKCLERGHSTPKMAAEFALEIQAEKLVIFHISQRYKQTENCDPNSPEYETSAEKLLHEAQAVFGSDVTMASDLCTFEIPLISR